jgi:phage-related tail protein
MDTHNDKWIVVKFDEIEKRLDQAFRLRDKEIDASKDELKDRLEKMNEIREQLDRQAATFPSREWVEGSLNTINLQISELDKAVSQLQIIARATEESFRKRMVVAGLIVAVIQVTIAIAVFTAAL